MSSVSSIELDGERHCEDENGSGQSMHFSPQEQMQHGCVVQNCSDNEEARQKKSWMKRNRNIVLLAVIFTLVCCVWWTKRCFDGRTRPIRLGDQPLLENKKKLHGMQTRRMQKEQCRSFCIIIAGGNSWFVENVGNHNDVICAQWEYYCGGCPQCKKVEAPEVIEEEVVEEVVAEEEEQEEEEVIALQEEEEKERKPCDSECYDFSYTDKPEEEDTCKWENCLGCSECSNEDPFFGRPDIDDLDPKSTLIFYSLGDTPYGKQELLHLPTLVREVPSDGAFLMHLGDIQKVTENLCARAQYTVVSNILKRTSKIPVFAVPGDNDYNDCPNVADGWKNWQDNFQRLEERWGKRTKNLKVRRPPDDFVTNKTVANLVSVTNFAFVKKRVLFMAVHLMGGAIHDANEWNATHAANVGWFQSNMRKHQGDFDVIVFFGHASPRPKHDDFFGKITPDLKRANVPTLYMHGDGHKWHVEEAAFGLDNVMRIQVDRGNAPAVKMVINLPKKNKRNIDPRQTFLWDRRLPPAPPSTSTSTPPPPPTDTDSRPGRRPPLVPRAQGSYTDMLKAAVSLTDDGRIIRNRYRGKNGDTLKAAVSPIDHHGRIIRNRHREKNGD